MKFKIISISVILVLLTILGVFLGLNWDICKAIFKKETIFTEGQVAEIQKGSIQNITKDELMSYIWEIVPELEEGHTARMEFKFKDNDEVDIWGVSDGEEDTMVLHYEIINGIAFLSGENNDYPVYLLLIKQNDIIRAGIDNENIYAMEKQVTYLSKR